MTWRRAAIIGLLATIGLAAGACSSSSPPSRADTVTIFGPYRGSEAERFTADLDRWASQNGIDVRYTGTGNLASDLESRVGVADPPDIAIVPQPGLIATLFQDGDVQALSPEVAATAEANMSPEALALGRFDGTQAAFPFRFNAKGLVWYRPSQLADLGLEPPRTLDQLDQVVQDIQDRGLTPWCLGVEAQSATGWPATDWVEELVVRQWGPTVYGQWVHGQVGFRDPRIAQSFDTFRQLVLGPGRAAGGTPGILRTSVQTANAPLFFDDPPGCVLYNAPSFALQWMPSGISLGPDADVAVFPLPATDDSDPPLVVGTDLAVSFNDRPDVQKVMAFLASPDAVRTWVSSGQFFSPTNGIDASAYPPQTRYLLEQSGGTDGTLVLDGSDAMPPAIGTDLFWKEITRWIAGDATYDEIASALDAAYPTTP